MYDILVKDAKICDGTGNPWYRGDIAIKNGRIAGLGKINEKARQIIKTRKTDVVCPGFIDVHTHSDKIVSSPEAVNMLRQGVTTVVSGNCGGSGLPVKDLFEKVEAARPAINFATLIGHGTVRNNVMQKANRTPTALEMTTMQKLVEMAMRDGALGISTGLFYVPGAYAQLRELAEVSRVVAEHNGVYATHKRSAGGKIFEAVEEAAAIGKKAGVRVQVSHLKTLHRKGRTKADRASSVLDVIEDYRSDGIDITCDVHPYTATNTSLAAVAIPPWVSQDGALKERLKDKALRKKIRKDVSSNIAWIGGPDKITIARFPDNTALNGKTLMQIAESRKQTAPETAMDLVIEGNPNCIFHALRQTDVSTILCSEHTMIASDGGIVADRTGVVHPRNYGTFPRVISEYVTEKKLLRLEDAIRKMTSMPARKFAIPGRGLIAEGMWADLVVFDPARITDNTTFEAPHEFPSGILYVMVNGNLAWDGHKASSRRSGMIVKKQV